MTECQQLPGRLRQICEGKSGLSLKETNGHRSLWGLPPLDRVLVLPPSPTSFVKRTGGPGTEFKALADSLKIEAAGCDCEAVRIEMDELGVAGCQRERERLLVAIRENAAHVSWLGKLKAAAMAVATGLAFQLQNPLDPIPELFDEAVRRAERKRARPAPAPKSGKCGSCGGSKKNSVERTRPRRQDAFPQPRPYTGPILRHLMYHLYPAKHSGQWKWNLDQLLQRIDVFNGQRILGLAIDKSTVSADEVRAHVGDRFTDIIEVKNDSKLGELATFPTMIGRLKTDDPNALIFYGHGKGASCKPDGTTTSGGRLSDMRRWAEAMYRGCLDDVPKVEAALHDHVFAGGFRHHKKGNWYFSGTFFWFRASAVFSRDWKLKSQKRYGVEFWPATITGHGENACLFGDNAGSLYDPKKLTRAIESMNDKPEPVITMPAASPGLTLITPTGDRPDAFALCERWMQRQTYSGPLQWIVVDDGSVQTNVTMGQDYIRRQPGRGEGHTLPKNLRLALPHVRHDKLLFIEDDDWYAPHYVDQMSRWLDADPLVGAGFARYYWPRLARYREFPEHRHASLCRTGLRRELFDDLQRCLTGNESIDMRLWSSTPGRRHDEQILCVSPKGMPGRKSGGGSPDHGIPDADLSQLRAWIGNDVDAYRSILPKTVDPARALNERIVVYTVVLGGHDTIRPPLVVNPNVRYVAITDGSAPAPWEVIRPPAAILSRPHESRRLKLLAHDLFPDADWTIYVDGQLQMAIDPLALLAECEAWGDGDLYLFRHQDRDCIYREAREVVRIGRDKEANVAPIIDRYRKAGVPEQGGLYLGGMLIRRRVACDAFNAAWWGEVASATHRDQISLPVALERSGVRFTPLPAMWWTHFFLRHQHNRTRGHGMRRRSMAR